LGARCSLSASARPSLPQSRSNGLFRLGDLDEAAGAAAYGEPSIVGVADIVWVTEKGDSCDPFTPDDAGGTSASELLEQDDPLLLAGGLRNARGHANRRNNNRYAQKAKHRRAIHALALYHDTIIRLLQFRAFRLGLNQDRDVGIGIFPESKEFLIRLARGFLVAAHRLGAPQLQVC
jgi:hypothetical protein